MPVTIVLDLSNVTNQSSAGEFYARLQTFATADASGTPTDTGGLALIVNNAYTVNAYVPPYLLFCVGVSIPSLNCANASGNYINFGYLSAFTTAKATSQMVVATNAQNGYSIQVAGSTMTSGNNIINPLTLNGASSTGTNQFGLNLVSNTSPAVGNSILGPGTGYPTTPYDEPNLFKYNSGDVIASSTQASDLREYTVSYIINIANNQPAGYYATTLTYVGVGNF